MAINKKEFGSEWIQQDQNKLKLIGNQCSQCQSTWFPKQDVCSNCLSENLEEKFLSNKGKVYSFTRLHVSPKGFESPLTVAYIDFSENVRVFGQVEESENHQIEIGASVQPVYGEIRMDHDEIPIYSYKFKLISKEVEK